MCPNGTTCLPADCYFSELELRKNPTQRVGLVQSGPYSRHDIAEKLLNCRSFMRVPRLGPLVEQELPTLPGHLNSPPIHVAR
jgi:hypothetical protein